MIASRRRTHFIATRILLPFGLAALFLPLAFRAPVSQNSAEIISELISQTDQSKHLQPSPQAASTEWADSGLFGAHPIRLTSLSDGSLMLKPLRQIDAPDVLLYWSTTTDVGERLPEDALLLGRISDTRERHFSMPENAAPGRTTEFSDGALVLYSLGHQSVIAVADLSSRRSSSRQSGSTSQ